MKSLPSSGADRVRQEKRRLVLEIFLRRGAVWDRIQEMRKRWGIEARTQMPPPRRGGPYFPESFGTPPPEEQFGNQEYDQWHATHREWTADLASLYEIAIPEEARSSKYFVASGWDIFLSACVLFDPPESRLVGFADFIRWEYSNVIPRGEHVGNALPIVWLRDADRVETMLAELYQEVLEAILEKYVNPQGVTSEDAIRSIHEERLDLFERYWRGIRDNESHPYIDVRPYHRKNDIVSAYTMLRERHAAQQPPGRTRDPLIALQCAILYDDHNGPNPEDGRERIYTHKSLAQMFGLQGPRAAKDYIDLGRKLRKNCPAK
jgi:hypothetical protein